MITVPPPVVQPSLQTESLVIYLSLLVLPLSYDDQKKECYKRDFYDPMQCSPWRDCLDARYCSCWVEPGVESWVAWTYFLCNACTNAQYLILNAFNASTQYCKHYKANKIMFFLEKKKNSHDFSCCKLTVIVLALSWVKTFGSPSMLWIVVHKPDW